MALRAHVVLHVSVSHEDAAAQGVCHQYMEKVGFALTLNHQSWALPSLQAAQTPQGRWRRRLRGWTGS